MDVGFWIKITIIRFRHGSLLLRRMLDGVRAMLDVGFWMLDWKRLKATDV